MNSSPWQRSFVETGHIMDKESKIIRNIFCFESLRVKDIMAPRAVISAFPEEMTIKDALELITKSFLTYTGLQHAY